MDKELYDKTDGEFAETPVKVSNTRCRIENAIKELQMAMDAVTLVNPLYKQSSEWNNVYDECETAKRNLQELLNTKTLMK